MKINIENSDKILKKYDPLILSMTNRFEKNDFEEVYDEAKMVAIEAILKFDESKSNFGGFLKYSLYYHFLDKIKAPYIKSLNEFDQTGTELQDNLESEIDIEGEYIDKENRLELYLAIEKLDAKERKILELKYKYGYPHKKIGEILNLSAKTITNKNYMINKKLKEILENIHQ